VDGNCKRITSERHFKACKAPRITRSNFLFMACQKTEIKANKDGGVDANDLTFRTQIHFEYQCGNATEEWVRFAEQNLMMIRHLQ
jgi:hypothetical protein